MEAYHNLSVLVTGGAGFIGSHLVRGLLDAGASVRVFDDLSNGSPRNLQDVADRVEFVQGDVRDAPAVSSAVAGRAVVFHLAALGSVPRSVEEPVLYNAVNVGGTLNVLDAARRAGVRRVVYSASSSAYGDTPVLPKVESMNPSPKSPYAVGKLVGEYYASVYADVYGLETVSLRYFNVFGPRQDPKSQYAAVIPAFVTMLLRGQRPTIYGDGEQTRDFCFVSNVARANMLAGVSPLPRKGPVYNVACGERISLNAMLAATQRLLGTSIEPVYKPARAGDVRDSLADISLIRRELGYKPAVMFAQGLKQTVAWYQGNSAGRA